MFMMPDAGPRDRSAQQLLWPPHVALQNQRQPPPMFLQQREGSEEDAEDDEGYQEEYGQDPRLTVTSWQEERSPAKRVRDWLVVGLG